MAWTVLVETMRDGKEGISKQIQKAIQFFVEGREKQYYQYINKTDL